MNKVTYASIYNLQAGDCIVEPLFQTGLTKHYAIYLGPDKNGKEWIAENHYQQGVRIIAAEIYFNPQKVINRIIKFKGNMFQRRQTIRRAIALKGKPYNLFSYNCEHYINEVLKGKPISNQVSNFLSLMLFSFLIFSASKSK